MYLVLPINRRCHIHARPNVRTHKQTSSRSLQTCMRLMRRIPSTQWHHISQTFQTRCIYSLNHKDPRRMDIEHVCRFQSNGKPCLKPAPNHVWYLTMRNKARPIWYCHDHLLRQRHNMVFHTEEEAITEAVTRALCQSKWTNDAGYITATTDLMYWYNKLWAPTAFLYVLHMP